MTIRRPDFTRTLGALDEPLLVVIAGSNGAGKTTFYERFLAGLPLRFVTADRIAHALSPGDPDRATVAATRLAAAMRHDLVARRESFITETVFSDPVGDKVRWMRGAQPQGYSVVLLFVGIASAELSAARVAGRVVHGGHDVPDDRLRDRYPRTLANLRAAVTFIDVAILLDNSDARDPYRPVATWRAGEAEYHCGEDERPAWRP
jgi:predicted ABC-type ATPase